MEIKIAFLPLTSIGVNDSSQSGCSGRALKRWFCQQSERESEAAVEGVGAVDAKYLGRGREAVLDRS